MSDLSLPGGQQRQEELDYRTDNYLSAGVGLLPPESERERLAQLVLLTETLYRLEREKNKGPGNTHTGEDLPFRVELEPR